MKFKVVGKSLILTDYSHKITEGENFFDTVEIAVPKSYDDCDLSTLSFSITVTSEDGKNSAVQMLKQTKCNEKYIYLKGTITSNFSAVTGKVTFLLTGINCDNVVAKFQSELHTVLNDISLNSLPNVTTAEQIYTQTKLEADRAKKFADRAEFASQTPAPAEIYPAADTRLGGIKSGNDIYVSESGSVTVNSVNGKTLGKSVPEDAVFTDTVYNDTDINNKLSEIISYIGYTDDIIGLHADFENNIFTRLGGAVGKSAGADFDIFPMYGGRRRCNVLDNGTITAYYGDSNFTEDGSNGQVMVYQPKFYYKVVPIKSEPVTNGTGYHLRCANYYISSTPKGGFKLHPAFYGENGEPVDYILFSAYEGSIFDLSENTYLQNDEQIADFSADKLSSIAGTKPCSGKAQNLIRGNIERLAQNRGKGWHSDTIKAESANQLLMAIEFAAFNMQAAIGMGVVSMSEAVASGATSKLGNSTGNADGAAGKASVSYRGMENPWGNIWKSVLGLNIYADVRKQLHGYICGDYNFSENTAADNYAQIDFSISDKDGYISSFGYASGCDWLFLPSEVKGSSSEPVGDMFYGMGAGTAEQWRIYLIGRNWYVGAAAGAFCSYAGVASSYKGYDVSSRLIFVPQSKNI